VIAEENPTVLEDMPLIPSEGQHDDYPPLAISSNPLFPNAIIRKPPNTHAKTAQKGKPAAPASGSAPTAIGGKSKDKGKDVKEVSVQSVGGRNAPTSAVSPLGLLPLHDFACSDIYAYIRP